MHQDMPNHKQTMDANNAAADAATGVKAPASLPEDISQAIRKNKGKIARIVIDRQSCIGARSCVVVAPGVFQVDDGNLAYVVDPESADEETILLAAQSCPVLAIFLYDKEGKQLFPEM